MDTDEILIVPCSLFIEDLSVFLKSLASFSEKNDVKIQGFDARKIVDVDHLFFSIHRARNSFSCGVNEAKDLGLEVLRFSSGQKQIDKSFSMGLISGENCCFFIFFGKTKEQVNKAKNAFEAEFEFFERPDLELAEKKPFLMKQFEITEAELNVAGEDKLKELVLERVALVDVTR